MNLRDNSLDISLAQGEKNVITWTGKSESRDPSALINPYFDDLLPALKDRDLLVRFEELTYMNSSTVPPIIRFIKNLEDAAITTTITYSSDSKWQAASFKALETIVRTMKHIAVRGV